MAKKERCVYGVNEPTSVNSLNTEYMKDYLTAKHADGTITSEQIAEYKKKKNAEIKKKEKETGKELKPVNKSQIERRVFVDCFMPELAGKVAKKIDFDAELDALING